MTSPPTLAGGGALTPDQSADFCGCSRRHFERWIAPFVPMIDVSAPGAKKPMPRYLVSDLLSWLTARRVAPR